MRKRDVKFRNLTAEMGRANISISELANKMNISTQILYKKLDGTSQFLYKDIVSIKKILEDSNKINYTLDYLFMEYDN